jgi:hypothetical protein
MGREFISAPHRAPTGQAKKQGERVPGNAWVLSRPTRCVLTAGDKFLQYPAKSSVRMSSSSTPAATSISLIPATMVGGPAL